MLLWPDHPAFTTPLSSLKGVGPRTWERLAAEGFQLTGDLLGLVPRFYQDRRRPTAVADLAADQEALVEVTVVSARAAWSPRTRRRYLTAQAEDDQGGRLALGWFNFPPYMVKSLARGRRLRLFGRVRVTGRGPEMLHPDIDFLPEAGDGEALDGPGPAPEIRPVYPPVGELPAGLVKKLIDQARPLLAGCPPLFPPEWLAERGLDDPVAALRTLHAPPGGVTGALPRPERTKAFRQLALFELLFWRLLMLRARDAAPPAGPRAHVARGRAAMRAFQRKLPFRLSPEQARVADELAADLAGPRPMSRLLQGEVGGGKTAVAASAMFFAVGRGGQAALMAPTEVLARQHYDFLRPYAEALGHEIVLLTGALPAKDKREARAALAEGRARLAVGSQALLSAATVFENLSLAVVDEQHRFGVRQRLTLRRKSERVDLLALSATPIPRSLALMLYGDLDSSTLHGLLPGRVPAETLIFAAGDRATAYDQFVRLVRAGGQGFLVTPRIAESAAKDRTDAEEGEADDFPSLEEIYETVRQTAGPDLPVARLHGRMPPPEQGRALAEFRDGRRRILVATSIIEVGVDVPTADVILIEGAERFGLAQLHQLRGRVGRGGAGSRCLLLPHRETPAGARRLAALAETHDGRVLSELDLEMRGPGEQLGLRQSGWPAMRYARLPQDLPLLPRAHELAEEIRRAPDLSARLDFRALEDRLADELPD